MSPAPVSRAPAGGAQQRGAAGRGGPGCATGEGKALIPCPAGLAGWTWGRYRVAQWAGAADRGRARVPGSCPTARHGRAPPPAKPADCGCRADHKTWPWRLRYDACREASRPPLRTGQRLCIKAAPPGSLPAPRRLARRWSSASALRAAACEGWDGRSAPGNQGTLRQEHSQLHRRCTRPPRRRRSLSRAGSRLLASQVRLPLTQAF